MTIKIFVSARSGRGYKEMSGTSMAAPHIAGAFALLIQAHPSKSLKETKEAMIKRVKGLGGAGHDSGFGWGRIDVMKSLQYLESH